MTMLIGDRVHCVIATLNLDFEAEVTEVRSGGVIMIKEMHENLFVLTTEDKVTPVPGIP